MPRLTFTSRKISLAFINLILLALVLGASMADNPNTAKAWSAYPQVLFDAGTDANGQPLYFSALKVCGKNQNGDYGCWDSSWGIPNMPEWTYSQYEIANWWWSLYDGANDPGNYYPISLTFYLDGYGWRTCDGGGPGIPVPYDYVRIKYQGNGVCYTLSE